MLWSVLICICTMSSGWVGERLLAGDETLAHDMHNTAWYRDDVATFAHSRPLRHCSCAPFPVANLRHVLPICIDVLFVFEQLVFELLFQVKAPFATLRQAINRVHREMKTIEIVKHGHIERSGDGAFFFVAADMKIIVIG